MTTTSKSTASTAPPVQNEIAKPKEITEQLEKIKETAKKMPGKFIKEKLQDKIMKHKEKKAAEKAELDRLQKTLFKPVLPRFVLRKCTVDILTWIL